jgi:hypothetical protein
MRNIQAPRTCPAWYGVKETPGHIVINWCADIGIIDARDIDISRGENRASEEEELKDEV